MSEKKTFQYCEFLVITEVDTNFVISNIVAVLDRESKAYNIALLNSNVISANC